MPRPAPIVVQNVEYIANLTDALTNIPDCKYQLKILSNYQVKILTHFKKIVNVLNDKNTEYFTYKPKELKGLRVIFRGIHSSSNISEIKEELELLGHEVLHIHDTVLPITKNPMPLFSVELKKKSV